MRTTAALLLVLGIGAAVYCCGPKPKPVVAEPTCPGGLHEVCEHDEVGAHDCYCPEE